MPDAHEIAEKLSPASQRALRWHSAREFGWHRYSYLLRRIKPAIVETCPAANQKYVLCRLTPLGLEVRRILETRQEGS